MMTREETQALIEELTEAASTYYAAQEPPMSDEDFDAKLEYLRSLVDAHPELFAEGTPGFTLLEDSMTLGDAPLGGAKVAHAIPMLSLAKANDEDTLRRHAEKMLTQGAQGFRLQAKLDGFALTARYSQGKLQTLASRGDGTTGEDITYLATASDVTVQGLPATIAYQGALEVRGELFFTDEQFAQADDARLTATGERFKNSRNAVAGLMKKAKKGVGFPVTFTFGTYSAYRENTLVDLTSLSEAGFVTVDALTRAQVSATTVAVQLGDLSDAAQLIDAVEAFGKARESFTTPTDGVVVKPMNEAAMQATLGSGSHHPRSQIAYKYPDETAESEVLGFSISVGKTGRVVPTAVLRPTDLSGIIVTSASCHNFRWVRDMDLRVGSKVLIFRANEVIPQVRTVLSNPEDSEPLETPTTCPTCASELVYDVSEGFPPKTLTCENSTCPSREFHGIIHAVGRNVLDIDGLSEATLRSLKDDGVIEDVADLFTIDESVLANSANGYSPKGAPRRLGEKRAAHIMRYIERAKSDTPLAKALLALNIEGLGGSTAKLLAKQFGTIDAILEVTEHDLATLEGIGGLKAEAIVSGLRRRRALVSKLRDNGFIWRDEVSKGVESTSPLAGLSFSISGEVPSGFANRGAWVSYLEEQGATLHSSPKKDTSFMVGDPQGASAKLKKAVSLGVDFISADEFMERFVAQG